MESKQFEIVLGALADKIRDQETTIILKDYEIKGLKEKLAEAEETNKKGKKPEKNLEIR